MAKQPPEQHHLGGHSTFTSSEGNHQVQWQQMAVHSWMQGLRTWQLVPELYMRFAKYETTHKI